MCEKAEFYRESLKDIKAAIEHTQTNEVRSHFTKSRPMAEMAQIYAMICVALDVGRHLSENEPKVNWSLVE